MFGSHLAVQNCYLGGIAYQKAHSQTRPSMSSKQFFCPVVQVMSCLPFGSLLENVRGSWDMLGRFLASGIFMDFHSGYHENGHHFKAQSFFFTF